MTLCAAVMTGPGAGAIATIGLCGESAPAVLGTVFQTLGAGGADSAVGRIVLGHIVDGSDTIDQVTVGCEAPGEFAIHCHGNPLIVEAIMKLLQRHGAELLSGPQWRAQILAATGSTSSLAIEVRLALTTVKTVEGARIIAGQTEGGLGRLCKQWQAEAMSLGRIKEQVTHILCDSDTARLIVSGCRLVLVGPPNTGKSTLLNALAGREKAIVTDFEGTTRDWVSAEIHIPPLAATVIDTAGLGADISGEIDKAAQARSVEMFQHADLVLLVLDGSRPAPDLPQSLLDQLTDKRTVIVLNKADLSEYPELTLRMPALFDPIRVSAQQRAGIDELILAVHRALSVDVFDLHRPIAFTDRQRDLLRRLQTVSSKTEADAVIAELLEGLLSV